MRAARAPPRAARCLGARRALTRPHAAPPPFPGKESIAGNNCFNCGTDKLVTYEAICEAAGDAVGRNVDVQTGPIGEKSSFPFRPTVDGFANEVEKLKWALKWEDPKHDVLEDLKTWYKDAFVELGLDQGELDTSKDLKPAPEDVDA